MIYFTKKNNHFSLRPDSFFIPRKRLVNPHTLVAQKVVDEVVLQRFQGEGVEFFLIEPY